MRGALPFLIACALAAAAPLVARDGSLDEERAAFPGWPTDFEGRELERLPLEPREARYFEGFPGRVARFTDGERQIVLRWIPRPTRHLHAAADCFQGRGFAVTPAPAWLDPDGVLWGRFHAERGDERLLVRELLWDGGERTWSDVSAWYWSAMCGRSVGPWWSALVAGPPDRPAD